MNIDTKDVVSVCFILILAYLLLNNGSETTSIFNALGTQTTSLISTLQGNGGNNNLQANNLGSTTLA